ncbi:MAG: MgtC/SapB family protein, partial [Caldimonas sp.]
AAVLLDMKPTLHRWLQLIEHRELSAALQMLVLSAVVLPLLPDRGYGPYEVLNPYRLWWAVVLVAGLSMAGHVAMRITGAQRGSLWTGVLGGLASSTAATLALSRRVRAEPRLLDAGAAGILAACGVMFLRMTVIVAVLQPALARSLAVPLVAAGVALLVIAAWQWRRRERAVAESAMQDAAPFDLSMALGFAAFLGLMAVLVRAAGDWLGAPGLYGLAALSGLADVDAILISSVRMNAAGALPLIATAWVAGIAAATNMVTKAVMAWLAGSVPLGRRVALGYLVALAVGALAGAAWIA